MWYVVSDDGNLFHGSHRACEIFMDRYLREHPEANLFLAGHDKEKAVFL